MNSDKPHISFLTLLLILNSCLGDFEAEPSSENDLHVFLIAGQSNTHYGEGYDSTIDTFQNSVFQLGRFDIDYKKIIPATQPLQFRTARESKISFTGVFTDYYLDFFDHNNSIRILLIPCAVAGTGFISNDWNKGDPLYQEAVERTKFVLQKHKSSSLKGILWLQGEHDIDNPNFQIALDSFIDDIRLDLSAEDVPFILGGMVPYWVEKDSIRQTVQTILKETTFRKLNTGYADPSHPFVIEKTDNNIDTIHYDASGQRELGKRFFTAFQALKNN